jgi:ABC-2 type transport system permease protein
MLKTNLQSAMEYRISFIMQVVAMIIGDASFTFIWIVFFKRFPVVNGWQSQDMMLLMALGSLSIGVYAILAEGTLEIARKVASGELDHHLSFPQNTLWNVAMSKTFVAGFGDLIFGVGLYLFYADSGFGNSMLFTVVTLVVALIFFNFVVITQSIAFYVSNFEDAAEQLWVALFFSTSIPQGSFHGLLKLMTMSIIPGFFIAELPVRLLRVFNLWHFLALLGFAVATLLLAIFVFKQGLKRYESGSLINVKM